MIYIIEIPHQLPPICWFAEDKAAVICMISESLTDEIFEGLTEDEEYEALLDANRSDLSSMHVFEDDAAALAALEDNSWWKGHQASRAREALRRGLVPSKDQ